MASGPLGASMCGECFHESVFHFVGVDLGSRRVGFFFFDFCVDEDWSFGFHRSMEHGC